MINQRKGDNLHCAMSVCQAELRTSSRREARRVQVLEWKRAGRNRLHASDCPRAYTTPSCSGCSGLTQRSTASSRAFRDCPQTFSWDGRCSKAVPRSRSSLSSDTPALHNKSCFPSCRHDTVHVPVLVHEDDTTKAACHCTHPQLTARMKAATHVPITHEHCELTHIPKNEYCHSHTEHEHCELTHIPRMNTATHIPRMNTATHIPRMNTASHIPRMNTATRIPRMNTETHIPRMNTAN